MKLTKKTFTAFFGSLLFLMPLKVNATSLNKSFDDFSNINISEEIKATYEKPEILAKHRKKKKKKKKMGIEEMKKRSLKLKKLEEMKKRSFQLKKLGKIKKEKQKPEKVLKVKDLQKNKSDKKNVDNSESKASLSKQLRELKMKLNIIDKKMKSMPKEDKSAIMKQFKIKNKLQKEISKLEKKLRRI